MDAPLTIERALLHGNTLLQAVLLARLFFSGLAKKYRWFAGYLAASAGQAVLLAFFPSHSVPYYYSWLATEPLIWALYFLVVLELYSLVLREYEGLATVGRWALKTALVIAVLLAMVIMMAGPAGPGEQHWMMKLIVTLQKTVGATLSLFLVGITGFLAFYPVPLRRNVIVYCVIFFIYFLSLTVGMLVREALGPERMADVNLALMSLYSLCLLGWMALLSPAGERVRTPVPALPEGMDERELLDQLSAINSAVLRSIKK